MRTRNYYSQKEIIKKFEVLSLASVFLEGAFIRSNHVDSDGNWVPIAQHKESFRYRDRTYSPNSLMNASVAGNDYFDVRTDSILTERVKKWLYENQKDSIKWVLDELMEIVKQENLESNISSQKWLDLVYDYPQFTNYTLIKKSNKQDDYSSNYQSTIVSDSTAVDIAAEAERKTSSTYFVPYRTLQEGCRQILRAYEDPAIDLQSCYLYLYFSMGIAIFSFKITSRRNWLINIALLLFSMIFLITLFFWTVSGDSIWATWEYLWLHLF